jgi:hypothetical protein
LGQMGALFNLPCSGASLPDRTGLSFLDPGVISQWSSRIV